VLTPTQRMTAARLASGYTQKLAAERAGIGERTIRNWLANPEFKAAAMVGIAEGRRALTEEQLADDLASEDPMVRRFAIVQLDRLGFSPPPV
jgi:transposase